MGTLIVNPCFRLWSPFYLNGEMDFWFDARNSNNVLLSGSYVTGLLDSSPNQRSTDAGYGAATYDNTPNNEEVVFNGTSSYFLVSLPTPSTRSICLVSSKGNFAYPAISGARWTSYAPTWNVNGARSEYRRSVSGGATQFSVNDGSGGSSLDYGVGCFVMGTGRDLTISHNGTSVSQQIDSNWVTNDKLVNTIGRDFAGATQYFDGAIKEFLILPYDLLESDRQKIEGYLSHKWGLTAKLPVTHPYKNNPPYV